MAGTCLLIRLAFCTGQGPMPKLIPQTVFFGAPSVIEAEINSPKQFFRHVSVLWKMVFSWREKHVLLILDCFGPCPFVPQENWQRGEMVRIWWWNLPLQGALSLNGLGGGVDKRNGVRRRLAGSCGRITFLVLQLTFGAGWCLLVTGVLQPFSSYEAWKEEVPFKWKPTKITPPFFVVLRWSTIDILRPTYCVNTSQEKIATRQTGPTSRMHPFVKEKRSIA